MEASLEEAIKSRQELKEESAKEIADLKNQIGIEQKARQQELSAEKSKNENFKSQLKLAQKKQADTSLWIRIGFISLFLTLVPLWYFWPISISNEPATSLSETEGIVNTTNLTEGIVNTTNLAIRLGPYPDSEIITILSASTPLTAIGHTSDGSRALVRLPNGQDGWVAAEFVKWKFDVNTLPIIDTSSTLTPALTPTPTITPVPTLTPFLLPGSQEVVSVVDIEGLLFRPSTGLVSKEPIGLGLNTQLIAIARNSDTSRALVRLPNGQEGWVSASGIQSNESLELLPVRLTLAPIPSTSSNIEGIVTTTNLTVRSGPTIASEIMTYLAIDIQLTAIARNSDRNWVYARLTDGQEGWVAASGVQWESNINTLPIRSQ